MLQEISNSVSSVFRDRIVSPLFGTFFISWCAWNWRLIYYLIAVNSRTEVQARFSYINEQFINYNSLTSIANIIVGPLITTVIWLLVYPIANGKIETYFAHKKAGNMRQIQVIEKTIPLSHEDAMAIYEKAEKQQERYDKLSRDNHERIAKLNKENELLKNREVSLEETNQMLREKLEEKQENSRLQKVENEELKAELNHFKQELSRAEFNKWADIEPLIIAYKDLKKEPELDRAYSQIINQSQVSSRKAFEVDQNKIVLNQLMDKGLISSFIHNENNKYLITLSRIGWQLIDLYRYRTYVESYESQLERKVKRASIKSF